MSKWTKREEDTALYLYYNEDKSYREISDKVTKTYGVYRSSESVRKKIRMLSDEDLEEADIIRPIELDLSPSMYSGSSMVDRFYDDYAQVIDIEESYHEKTEDLAGMIGKPRKGRLNYKVAFISDLHIPHMNVKAFQQFLDENKDADVCVLGGDIGDHDAVSFFKSTNPIMPIIQFEQMKAIAEILEKYFPLTVWLSGNHDDRLEKYFLDHVDHYVSPLVHSDMISMIVDGYSVQWDQEHMDVEDIDDFFKIHGKKPLKANEKIATLYKGKPLKKTFYKNNANKWWAKVGHVLFTHANRFLTSGPLKTTLAIDNTFAQHPIYYEAIVQAHTHKQGSAIFGKKLFMEPGCCCHAPAYAAGPKCRYGPQTIGWAELYLDRSGHVDFRKSHNVYYGTTSSILR